MTTKNDNDNIANPDPTAAPARSPVAPPPVVAHQPPQRRRHSIGVVIGAGVAGLLVGALGTIAAIAFAWIISVGPPGPPPPTPLATEMHHGPPPPPEPGPTPAGPSR